MNKSMKINGFKLRVRRRQRSGKPTGKPYYEIYSTYWVFSDYRKKWADDFYELGFNAEGYATLYKYPDAEQLLTVLRLKGC